MSSRVLRPVVRTSSVLLFALLVGCGGGERDIVEPPLPEPTDFTLTVRSHAEDAAVAQQLGWTGGLPSTEVTITPADGGAAGQVLTTSANGTVTLDALAPGTYRVSARRLLSAAEQAQLGAASGVVAFVGEAEVGVGANTRTATVQLPASYRRSLVISEWGFRSRYIVGSGTYSFGGYMELYNNSDTTVYLDGVLVGSAYSINTELPHLSCATSSTFWNDPAGAWVLGLAAFPGTGRQYPLAPGEQVVVATDAIDHSAIFPGMIDLSGADFEFFGAADVDNPTVPNMLDVGTFGGHFGHGMQFGTSLGQVVAIGAATDPATLPRQSQQGQGRVLLRIDRERLLDVFATTTTYYLSMQPPPVFCDAMIHPSLDRKHGFFLEDSPDDYLVSMSRKVLGTLPDGRLLLQHTRTSANDFRRTPRTPGTVQE